VQDHCFCLSLFQGEKAALNFIVSRKAAVAAAVGAETGDIERGVYLGSFAKAAGGDIRRARGHGRKEVISRRGEQGGKVKRLQMFGAQSPENIIFTCGTNLFLELLKWGYFEHGFNV